MINNKCDKITGQPKKEDLLSFKPTGRPIELSDLNAEFSLMKNALQKELTPEVARRICEKSGSHLIKLVSPRVDGDNAVLRVDNPKSNKRAAILPSVNAPDIPFCKVAFRPLEIVGYKTASIIDHILNPDDHSDQVLKEFADVFGDDVLTEMSKVLLEPLTPPKKLGAGEFPIIFVPRPDGRDLQITPVSPAHAFMGMKSMASHYFQKRQPDGPMPPRGRWVRQAISAKPQNISGAIGGGRLRFHATMPPSMQQTQAELYRYINGGNFPRWRDDAVATWVLRYAQMLNRDQTFNNQNTRSALEQTADRLIDEAANFIEETHIDAKIFAQELQKSVENLKSPPGVTQIIMRRNWGSTDKFNIARNALTSQHFQDRLRKSNAVQEATR